MTASQGSLLHGKVMGHARDNLSRTGAWLGKPFAKATPDAQAGIFRRMGGWVKNNPGKAVAGATLLPAAAVAVPTAGVMAAGAAAAPAGMVGGGANMALSASRGHSTEQNSKALVRGGTAAAGGAALGTMAGLARNVQMGGGWKGMLGRGLLGYGLGTAAGTGASLATAPRHQT